MAELTTFAALEQKSETQENPSLEETTTSQEATTIEDGVIETPQLNEATEVVDESQKTAEETEIKSEEKADDNTSAFALDLGEEAKVEGEKEKPKEEQKSFSLDEELKKIDKKELLKKAGLSDFEIELNEHISKGGKAEDYIVAKAIDYSQISDEDLVKQDLRKQYPDFTKDEINRLFNRKYGVTDLMDEEEREDRLLELKADGSLKRKQKIEAQKSFKIPDNPILHTDEAYESWKKNQESQSQLMEQYRNYYNTHEATKALNESKRVAINLGEGVAPFNFTIEQPEVITRALTDGGVIMNKLTTTQSGEPDVEKQQLITLFSFNPKKFVQDIFKYGQSMGVRKELVEEGQNAQRPQAKVTKMDSNEKPTVSVGKFSDRTR